MLSPKFIKTILEYSKKYDNNIYSLINELDIVIIKNPFFLKEIALTVSYEGIDLILISPSLNEYERQFVLAHEVAHILFHDKNTRAFSKIYNNKDKFETEANLFATLFLQLNYSDNINNLVQKTINYIYSNYIIFIDFTKIK